MRSLRFVLAACIALLFLLPAHTQSVTRYCIYTRQAISGEGYAYVFGGRTYYVCCPPHLTRLQSWTWTRQKRFTDLWRTRAELMQRKIDTEQAMDRVKVEE